MSFHDSKTVITRKEHKCEGCLVEIPKGSKVEYNKGVFDGDFYSYYFCDECRKFIDNADPMFLDDLRDYGFNAGDIGESRRCSHNVS